MPSRQPLLLRSQPRTFLQPALALIFGLSGSIAFSYAGSSAFRLAANAHNSIVGPCSLRQAKPFSLCSAKGMDINGASKSVVVISDSTGQTAAALTERLLLQFQTSDVVPEVTVVPQVTNVERLSEVIREAAKLGDDVMIMTTLVDSDMAQWAKMLCSDSNLRHIDVMTPLIDEFSSFLEEAALGLPGGSTAGISKRKVSKMVSRDFFGMVEAVKYGQRHVAGLNPQDWRDADLVLVGPSRVGKGPVAHYLAQRGVKVASLNTSPHEPLPAELEQLGKEKVAMCIVEEERLVELRLSRIREAQRRNMPMLLEPDYASLERVRQDLEFVLSLQQSHPDWGEPVDLSYMAVEEAASVLFRRVVSTRKAMGAS